jgi:hypothetical protein
MTSTLSTSPCDSALPKRTPPPNSQMSLPFSFRSSASTEVSLRTVTSLRVAGDKVRENTYVRMPGTPKPRP